MAVPDLRSNSYYMSKFSPATQVNGRRSYEELTGSYVPPGLVSEHCFTNQQRLYNYRQPYSMTMNQLNPPPLQFSSHQAIQEPILPKFPPQMFDIPDIHDSNSVFNEGTFDMNGTAAAAAAAAVASKQHMMAFEPSASAPPAPPPAAPRTLMPFLGDWQPRFISAAAGSTNSSPLTHSEENNSYDVPLSQPLAQQQNVFISSVSKPSVKKAKSPKKRKRKDPNEPQKPVSAYSLFFRNAQAAIKSQNPTATFGDISKIVASMWDNLDNEIKRFYKRQMEAAKKEYLKQLAVYRANLTTQQESEGRSAAGNKDEADQPPQQAVSAKASSSLISSQADESISQRPSVTDAVQTQEHSSVQLPRPSSVEAVVVHKMPVSQQHGMSQQLPQSPPVYFQELVPGGPSQMQSPVYGGGGGGQSNLPPMPRNMFQSYNERSDYFGSGGGMAPNIYADRGYPAPGLWSHSLQNTDYSPVHDNFLARHSRDVTVGLRGLSEVNDSIKWT